LTEVGVALDTGARVAVSVEGELGSAAELVPILLRQMEARAVLDTAWSNKSAILSLVIQKVSKINVFRDGI